MHLDNNLPEGTLPQGASYWKLHYANRNKQDHLTVAWMQPCPSFVFSVPPGSFSIVVILIRTLPWSQPVCVKSETSSLHTICYSYGQALTLRRPQSAALQTYVGRGVLCSFVVVSLTAWNSCCHFWLSHPKLKSQAASQRAKKRLRVTESPLRPRSAIEQQTCH